MTGNVIFGLTTPGGMTSDYPANHYLRQEKPTVESFVRPNRYEPGRAHIVVYNWPLASEVSIDLGSAGLRPGTRYQVLDVQDYFGIPVVSGVYEGKPVAVPLRPRPVPPPVGNIQAPRPGHTLPEFGVFVVTPVYARLR